MSPSPRITHIADMEAADKLLFVGIVLFTVILIGISKWSPNDGQTFQVVSGLLTGFSAAFLARLKPSSKSGDAALRKETPNA